MVVVVVEDVVAGGGIVDGLGDDEVVEVEVTALDDDRLDDTEFDVFGVESVDIAVAPVGEVDVLVDGAVVAGGATTVPLLKLTAPKLEVKAAAPGLEVGVVCPLAIGDAPVDLETAPLLLVKEAVEDLEAEGLEAKGGNLSTESPVVRRLCFDEFFAAPFDRELLASTSGGNGEATTLTTGGEAAGTAFISTLRPSKTTTSSPTF